MKSQDNNRPSSSFRQSSAQKLNNNTTIDYEKEHCVALITKLWTPPQHSYQPIGNTKMRTNSELGRNPIDDDLYSQQSQDRRNYEHSKNTFRMEKAKTWTSSEISKYTNYPECQELLNTMNCY